MRVLSRFADNNRPGYIVAIEARHFPRNHFARGSRAQWRIYKSVAKQPFGSEQVEHDVVEETRRGRRLELRKCQLEEKYKYLLGRPFLYT